MPATPELEARNLSIEYERVAGTTPALSGIDLAIDHGQFLAVLGPSGSGKTTLLNAFAGFIRPTAGNVYFRGQPIVAPAVVPAVVFQRHAFFHCPAATENIAFPLKLRGIGKHRRRALVTPLIL